VLIVIGMNVCQPSIASAFSPGGECRRGGIASFDCTKATTGPERAICHSAEASVAHCLLGYVYKDAADSAKAQGSYPQLEEQELAWIASRNMECGTNEACLTKSIKQRALLLIQEYDLLTFGTFLKKGIYSPADFAVTASSESGAEAQTARAATDMDSGIGAAN
jgi:uncharacterized protein